MSKNKQPHIFLEKANSLFPILLPISILISFPAAISVLRFLAVQQQLETPVPYQYQFPEDKVGLMSHGTFVPWFTIEGQPIIFGLSVIALIIPLILFLLWGGVGSCQVLK